LFSRFNCFGKAIGLSIVIGIKIWLWSLLFIIPGIIAWYRHSMAFYVMAEHPEIGVIDAIEESKRLMAGNKASLFILSLSFIGWRLLCILTCGVGFVFLIPYTNAATAAFYLRVSGGGADEILEALPPTLP